MLRKFEIIWQIKKPNFKSIVHVIKTEQFLS